ncbi:hypothetical protein, partial [Psychrobacter sanguinis]
MSLVNLSKLSFVVVLGLGAVACSSGGSSSSFGGSSPIITPEQQAQKIEANRVALVAKAKKAGLTEAQANAYAEANKEASAKDAENSLNKILSDIAEAQRLEKIEANRVALVAKAKKAGLTDAQANAYAEANKEASAKDAENSLNKILSDIAEAQRLEKIEANRVALVAKAKKAGLTDAQA